MTKDATQIFSVLDISDLILFRNRPPTLYMRATGLVSSSGWSDPRLVPVEYVTPPEDGLQEFELVARPPEGVSLTVMTPIAVEVTLPAMPEWARGVRVRAQHNEIEMMFPAYAEDLDGAAVEEEDFLAEGTVKAETVQAEPYGGDCCINLKRCASRGVRQRFRLPDQTFREQTLSRLEYLAACHRCGDS